MEADLGIALLGLGAIGTAFSSIGLIANRRFGWLLGLTVMLTAIFGAMAVGLIG